MNRINATLSLLLLLVITACNSGEHSAESKDLVGTWTLFKEEKSGKTIDYSGVPSATKIEFKENGYFLLFDKITDEKMSNSGVGTIQDNLKGQYELSEKTIKMNHYVGDSLITKEWSIQSVDGTTLIVKDNKSGKTSHFKK